MKLVLLERAVHNFSRLLWETGKAVTGHVTGEVPGTSFFIDRSTSLELYV